MSLPVESRSNPASVGIRSSDSSPLLSLEDLRVYFKTKRGVARSVDGVSLTIGEGETLGLVGETGSGKTVTARSLIRLVPTPPGIHAGGRALFRPKEPCPDCAGAGCTTCAGQGRLPTRCPNCDGVGCPACGSTGRETIDLLTAPERRIRKMRGNHVAMIFQDPGKALNPSLTIRDQLAEVFAEHRSSELLREAGLDSAGSLLTRDAHRRASFWERRLLRLPPLRGRHRRLEAVLDERIVRALTDTRIPNPRKIMRSYPHELSGGMKQRVMIAQALACDPDLLIADEPTTALDVTIQARILDLLAELQDRHRTAILYISHDLSLVRSISDRVAVMYAGRLAEVGSTDRIFERPLHPYTRGLLGAIPGREHRRGSLVAIEGMVPELVDDAPSCRFHTRCPKAAKACEDFLPQLQPQSTPDHLTACLLYDPPDDPRLTSADLPGQEGSG